MSAPPDHVPWQIIVPVRGGVAAKTRLAMIEGRPLTAAARVELTLAMATDTISAAVASGCGRVSVLTADESVAALAGSVGAAVLPDLGRGLNAELYAALARHGPDASVAVLLGDLPAARGSDVRAMLRLAQEVRGAYLPDWEGTGTAAVAFAREVSERQVAFGRGSARRHHELGLTPVGLDVARLRCDVDTASAWARAVGLGLGPATAAVRARLLDPAWAASEPTTPPSI